jgi:hypothetical protein
MTLKDVLLGTGLIGWATAVAGTLYAVEYTESKPCEIVSNRTNWPSDSNLRRSLTKPTLLLFSHPKCPCTRSSLEELDKIVSADPSFAKVIIVFADLRPADPYWAETDLWQHAKRIPGAEVLRDENAIECRHFSAFTSGTAILFSKTGAELFRGGLTTSRGHEGESIADGALATFLKSGVMPVRSAPVFGCALFAKTTGVSQS